MKYPGSLAATVPATVCYLLLPLVWNGHIRQTDTLHTQGRKSQEVTLR